MNRSENKELKRRFPLEVKLAEQLNQAAQKAGMEAHCAVREHSSGHGGTIILQTNSPEQVQQLIQAINLA